MIYPVRKEITEIFYNPLVNNRTEVYKELPINIIINLNNI